MLLLLIESFLFDAAAKLFVSFFILGNPIPKICETLTFKLIARLTQVFHHVASFSIKHFLLSFYPVICLLFNQQWRLICFPPLKRDLTIFCQLQSQCIFEVEEMRVCNFWAVCPKLFVACYFLLNFSLSLKKQLHLSVNAIYHLFIYLNV